MPTARWGQRQKSSLSVGTPLHIGSFNREYGGFRSDPGPETQMGRIMMVPDNGTIKK